MPIDPAEEDEHERDARLYEVEDVRRWDAFVDLVLGFEEIEGWPGVLRAVAQAMREREIEEEERDSATDR